MTLIDEQEIAKVMAELPDVLAREELVVQRTLPRLSPADALDTALKRSLARLRYELSRESFEYLRWKVSVARAESERLRHAAAIGSTLAQLHPRGIARHSTQTRTFTCDCGSIWTVSELNTLTPTDPTHTTCLVFSSEESVACVWDYPSNWLELPDEDLDAIRRDR